MYLKVIDLVSDPEENDEPSKYLIVPEDLFKSKKLQQKSLADIAILGLQPHIEQLPEKRSIMTAGNTVTSGGNYEGSIRTAGNFVTKGLTVANKITIAGNSVVKDLMIVKDNSTLAGNVTLRSNAIFAGKTRIAGTINVNENIISSNSLTLAGNATIRKQIITDGKLTFSGNVTVDQIQSLSEVIFKGKAFVTKDVKAKKFRIHNAEGMIGGDIIAKIVAAGNNRQLKRYIRNYEDDKNLANPVELIKYIGKLIINPFSKGKSHEPFEIEGDIIADEVFLENLIVHGDINARRITIGDNVIIDGMVEYAEELNILGDSNYNTKQIATEELLYLDPDQMLKLDDSDDHDDETVN